MFNHNHGRPDEGATAVVIDLFAKKRDRLSKRFGALHPTLRPGAPQEAPAALATVTPIDAGRHRQISSGD